MYNQLFKCPRAIERHLSSPLYEERSRYLAHCAAQGSTKSSLRLIAQQMLVFIDYLDLKSDGEVCIKQVYEAADQWVNRQPHPNNVTDYRYGRMRFISEAKKWLHFLGRLLMPEVQHRPYTHMIEEYIDHMAREKGLAQDTIRIRCWHLEQFFNRFWPQHRPFNQITIADIDAAIARKGNQDSYSRTSIKSYATALRSFFRYAEERGWCNPGMATAIMSPRLYADESLPKGPSWQDVHRLLASTEGDLPKDIRDRAIIMLFAVYGMRVGEVRALRLEDLNWENELIYVTRPKLRRRQLYPLSHTVGEAILRYLREVRPRSTYREIFLTLRAPLKPIGSGVLYDIVSDRLRALEVPLKHYGPHSLRHACGTRLLTKGLSMKEIGDHLGHRKIDTTRVYAKVDIAGLRQVADFELGGVL